MITFEVGTLLRVRANRALVVGRNNRAAVRKGTETTARVLAPLPFSSRQSLVVTATEPGMGDTYCNLDPHDVTVLGIECPEGHGYDPDNTSCDACMDRALAHGEA